MPVKHPIVDVGILQTWKMIDIQEEIVLIDFSAQLWDPMEITIQPNLSELCLTLFRHWLDVLELKLVIY